MKINNIQVFILFNFTCLNIKAYSVHYKIIYPSIKLALLRYKKVCMYNIDTINFDVSKFIFSS